MDFSSPERDYIREHGPEIQKFGPEGEELMRLSDRSAEILRDSGIMRMTQPKKFGGTEKSPLEWASAVMEACSWDGATGWLGGIVGVHPWEIALMDDKVGEEIWGENPDTWIASPYAPMGVAKKTDDGYLLSGRWQFSSGCDHSDWIFLGALEGDENGDVPMPPRVLHVVLPMKDVEIQHESWQVMGLSGTGSKDIVVKDAYIPSYRALDYKAVQDGSAAREKGLDNPLFLMPFSNVFPLGITSAVLGMSLGALRLHMDFQSKRTQITGTKVKDDPYVLTATGEAAAEIESARVSLLANAQKFYEQAAEGKTATYDERMQGRRDQIAAAWRAWRATNELLARTGGNGLRKDNPIQRFWRDMQVGLVHAVHVPGPVTHASALTAMGVTPPPGPALSIV